jgi:hypothetical protein
MAPPRRLAIVFLICIVLIGLIAGDGKYMLRALARGAMFGIGREAAHALMR